MSNSKKSNSKLSYQLITEVPSLYMNLSDKLSSFICEKVLGYLFHFLEYLKKFRKLTISQHFCTYSPH